jgi:hypothetical protein
VRTDVIPNAAPLAAEESLSSPYTVGPERFLSSFGMIDLQAVLRALPVSVVKSLSSLC